MNFAFIDIVSFKFRFDVTSYDDRTKLVRGFIDFYLVGIPRTFSSVNTVTDNRQVGTLLLTAFTVF